MTKYALKRLLLSFIYPNRCPFCGEIIAHDQYYCPACPETAGFYENTGDKALTVFKYDGAAKTFVNKIKENADGYAFAAAAKLLSLLIADTEIDLITCIPASKVRLRRHGYNPPAMVARELAAIMNVPCDTKLLVKTRETHIQKELNARERRENLKGVFAATKKINANTVLITDDVRVTGSTLSEAAKTLILAGAKSVITVAVAGT